MLPAGTPALQVAWQLLVFCAAPCCDHLLRFLPPAIGGVFGERIDQLLLENAQRLLSHRFTPLQARQLRLKVTGGGAGLRSRGGAFAAAAFLGSWAQCLAPVSLACDGAPLGDGGGNEALGNPFGA